MHVAPGGNLMLAEAGFGQSEERGDVIKAIGLIPNVDVAQQADPRIARAKLGENAMAAISAFTASPTGLQIRSSNAEYAANIEAGMLAAPFRTGEGEARARMTAADTLKAGPAGGDRRPWSGAA